MLRRIREARLRWQKRLRLFPVVVGFALALWGVVPLIGALTGSSEHPGVGVVAGLFLVVVGLAIGVPSLVAYRRASG